MSDTLLGDGFKVMRKTDRDVAHKLPTDNYNRGRMLCQRAPGGEAPTLARRLKGSCFRHHHLLPRLLQ